MIMRNRYLFLKRVILTSIAIVFVIFIYKFWLPNKVKVDCFVYDPCGGCFSDNNPCKPCNVVLEMEKYLFNKVDELGLREAADIHVYNVMYDIQKDLLMGRVQPGLEFDYPVLFVNDTALFGWNQINERFDELLLQMVRARPNRSVKRDNSINVTYVHEKTEKPVAIYFKRQDCRSCKKTEEYFAQKGNFKGLCEVLIYNIENEENTRLFEEYRKEYGVNLETAGAPMIFIGDTFLEGYEEIETFLEVYIESGYGLKTCIIKANKDGN